MPSPSRSLGRSKASRSLWLPHSISIVSFQPSPSSSSSALLPIPSSSVSIHSVGSTGKASMPSRYPSSSQSGFKRQPAGSSTSGRPSLSSSGSTWSGKPSPSKSGPTSTVNVAESLAPDTVYTVMV